ncbi:Uncharacterised protein [Achromobacter xylosoxidans]|jgi:hypothetical protein|nr:Uncharacterised protein [Achromobacter xylosoxidans]CUJ36258.1 Uncharacterised protein [Achromobacter xylosoxidans]
MTQHPFAPRPTPQCTRPRGRPGRTMKNGRRARANEKRPLTRPFCIGEAILAYQAATTAPLNLVSMNCFTAGLW